MIAEKASERRTAQGTAYFASETLHFPNDHYPDPSGRLLRYDVSWPVDAPPNGIKYKPLVMIPGLFCHKDVLYIKHAREKAIDRGMAVVSMDNAPGVPTNDPNDPFKPHTRYLTPNNLVTTISYALNHFADAHGEEIDWQDAAAHGTSMGGQALMRYDAYSRGLSSKAGGIFTSLLRPQRLIHQEPKVTFNTIILQSPVTSVPDFLEKEVNIVKFFGWMKQGWAPVDFLGESMALAYDVYSEYRALNPHRIARHVGASTLHVWGTGDPFLNQQEQARLHENLINAPRRKQLVFEGAGHALNKGNRPDYMDNISDYTHWDQTFDTCMDFIVEGHQVSERAPVLVPVHRPGVAAQGQLVIAKA